MAEGGTRGRTKFDPTRHGAVIRLEAPFAKDTRFSCRKANLAINRCEGQLWLLMLVTSLLEGIRDNIKEDSS
jgi:hypothetical protein